MVLNFYSAFPTPGQLGEKEKWSLRTIPHQYDCQLEHKIMNKMWEFSVLFRQTHDG